jgi:hypothetical protein
MTDLHQTGAKKRVPEILNSLIILNADHIIDRVVVGVSYWKNVFHLQKASYCLHIPV